VFAAAAVQPRSQAGEDAAVNVVSKSVRSHVSEAAVPVLEPGFQVV
jgi:hypothetical protein